MAFVDVGIGAAALFGAEGLSTAAAGAIGSGLVGAGAGALINGLSGRSVLNGALMGGAMGALGGGIGGAFMGAGSNVSGQIGADILSMQQAGATSAEISQALMDTYGMTAEQAAATMSQVASTGTTAGGINMGSNALQNLQTANMVKNVAGSNQQQVPQQTSYVPPVQTGNVPSADTYYADGYGPEYGGPQVGTPQAAASNVQTQTQTPSMFSQITDYMKAHPGLTATAAGAAILASQGKKAFQPNYLPTYTPTSASSMGLGRTLASNYQPVRTMAEGGIAALADGGLLQNGPAQVNFMGNDMYPQSQIDRSYYATPTQMPTSAQQTMASYEPKTNPLTGELTANMAEGGITAAGITGLQGQQQAQSQPVTMDYIKSLASQYGVALPTKTAAKGGPMGGEYNLGSYSDGGRLLKGPGDGMSDNIPATIADKQPARLADGEFVVSADVVSGLGNGSTDAGAKHLYKMMDNVRKARTGRKAQGKQIKADKFLPK
jgi:hypothetical protein